MKCEHKWVDVEDESLDKICSKCGKKAMQAAAYLEDCHAPVSMSYTRPISRETIKINTGKNALGKVTVYKDELLEKINQELGIGYKFL